ncbi:hypothetical protein PHYBLDRAFT_171952 [Phycomyces blakesleeanus NRRL 1555(-)]|uniref:SH3 domain-containing protein n=1 Tax=Phycomyces blakesleeanus (strain ATCC 8743b / DSM 1359 / FGSC 10004 / NBRC 33097 / NRRL 1555) TaxID=763407 RepID=A0A167L9W4_PHYB8|nr:hypothetical protein PHYBLDRAFT_171952 [Phycomyces blakesleeanus NRRL 1555(-)]OAD69929.1 hypothetical protein PHYBLDRAFT_171952 [Phycomyces blakesleeanus NRRL 1555(-)]|eukprot:XP_018287969.1 hypothetical protein PHYBLDRAFT_171952 [Phycomyces blakesleeanus NRRL 1555(-)]
MRNFARDRSHIEREYAQKLESLAKKYKQNSRSRSNDLATNDNDWNDSPSTCLATWNTLIAQTEQVSKARFQLVDDINNKVIESIKAIISRKEDARKKASSRLLGSIAKSFPILFAQRRLKSDREKSYTEKDKAKQAYDDSCAEIEIIKAKIDKGTGDQDKYQKQLDIAMSECGNRKNLYILALGVANAERAKYFEEDMPKLADYLEKLNDSRILALQDIFIRYIDCEVQALSTSLDHHNITLSSAKKIDPAVDSSAFIRSAIGTGDPGETAANVRFSYIPWNGGVNAAEAIVDRDSNLTTNESDIIFLNNRLIKDKKQLDTITNELSRYSSEADELKYRVDAIQSKGSLEYDKAMELLMESLRNITLQTTQMVKVKSEIEVIVQNIGDEGLKTTGHDFKPCSFTIPTTCDLCSNTIWGLSKQGFTCRGTWASCGFNCHAKCEMKITPNCSLVRGKIDRQQSFAKSQPFLSQGKQQSKEKTRNLSFGSSMGITPANISSNTNPILQVNDPASLPTVRALYSYHSQSPDELSIVEGDSLSIVGSKDDTGWIKVAKNGQTGLVPANYIDLEAFEQQTLDTIPGHTSNQPSFDVDPIEDQTNQTYVIDVVVALYDFTGVGDDELNLRQGDRIEVTKKEENGWWEGVLNQKVGIFPANYVRPSE